MKQIYTLTYNIKDGNFIGEDIIFNILFCNCNQYMKF